MKTFAAILVAMLIAAFAFVSFANEQAEHEASAELYQQDLEEIENIEEEEAIEEDLDLEDLEDSGALPRPRSPFYII